MWRPRIYDSRPRRDQVLKANVREQESDGIGTYYGFEQAFNVAEDPPADCAVVPRKLPCKAIRQAGFVLQESMAACGGADESTSLSGSMGGFWSRRRCDRSAGTAQATLNLILPCHSIYLTGHSWRPRQPWHIGPLFTDRFEAGLASAGWVSYKLYRMNEWCRSGTTPLDENHPAWEILASRHQPRPCPRKPET